MCYFMYAVSKNEIDSSVIENGEKANLYVRYSTQYVKDAREGYHYYDINNGHCACELVVSSYSRIPEIKDILKNLHDKGSFRFVIIDSDDEDEYLQQEKNSNFEKTLKTLPSEIIKFNDLKEKYPDKIDFDKVYIVE